MEFKKHSKNADIYSIWSSFLTSTDGSHAKCQVCHAVLKTLGGSTKGLHTHLLAKHNKKLLKREHNDEPAVQPPAQKKIVQFLKGYDSLEAVLARMTARDGLAFSIFITSPDLKQLLKHKGYNNYPKCSTTIRNMVMSYGEQIREQMKLELKKLKDSGVRFSLSFDEWTSFSNKRYMNVVIHSKNNKWNLGLIRIRESFTSEVCLSTLNQRLELFNITLSTDIVAIVTDGPHVMLKAGKIANAEHQVCFSHGIHLAVCDVLYQKNNASCQVLAMEDSSDANEFEDLDGEHAALRIENDCAQELTSDQNINSVIKKVRKIVLCFKRSPTKNDTVLQKYIKVAHGKEMCLLLDCKTRWNSLLVMLERFILLKESIQKALIDIKFSQNLQDDEYDLIMQVINVLRPLKLAAEALGRADANLCTADAALKFLFKQLSENNTILAQKLSTALSERLESRRKTELSGLLCYLQNPLAETSLDVGIPFFFSKPEKSLIIKQAIHLIEQLQPNYEAEVDIEIIEDKSVTEELSLQEMLNNEINQSMEPAKPKKSSNLRNILQMEFRTLQTGIRGPHFEKVYQYLLTIPPTSIEPERTFSAASYIGNKIRSRLGDTTLDTLIFLRFYFLNTQN